MEVKSCINGELMENCHCLIDGEHCFLVDPGDEPEKLIKEFSLDDRKLDYILLTHAHFDHIGAVPCIAERYNVPVLLHKGDADMISDPKKNLSAFMGSEGISYRADRILSDCERIEFTDSFIKVVHTPGHTPGSCCFIFGEYLFSGDTLFRLSVGRSDFPGGSFSQLNNSVRNVLCSLDGNFAVFTGHGDATTLDYERFNNPYMR